MGIKIDLVTLQVLIQPFSAQNFGYLDKLVVVVFALEKGLSLEHHSCEHAAQTPDIQGVMVSLVVHQ